MESIAFVVRILSASSSFVEALLAFLENLAAQ
jgi:hypothetical protein